MIFFLRTERVTLLEFHTKYKKDNISVEFLFFDLNPARGVRVVESVASRLLPKRSSFRMRHYPLSTINYQLSTINYPLSTLNSQ
jgi:hypothetical protein